MSTMVSKHEGPLIYQGSGKSVNLKVYVTNPNSWKWSSRSVSVSLSDLGIRYDGDVKAAIFPNHVQMNVFALISEGGGLELFGFADWWSGTTIRNDTMFANPRGIFQSQEGVLVNALYMSRDMVVLDLSELERITDPADSEMVSFDPTLPLPRFFHLDWCKRVLRKVVESLSLITSASGKPRQIHLDIEEIYNGISKISTEALKKYNKSLSAVVDKKSIKEAWSLGKVDVDAIVGLMPTVLEKMERMLTKPRSESVPIINAVLDTAA